jgi:hypothetical protein
MAAPPAASPYRSARLPAMRTSMGMIAADVWCAWKQCFSLASDCYVDDED